MKDTTDHNSDTPLQDKSAEWLLRNRMSIIKMLAVMRSERAEYDEYVEWQGIQPKEADRAVNMLLASGFDSDERLRQMLQEPTTAQPQRREAGKMSEDNIFLSLFHYIISNRIDVTQIRQDWLIIGAVLRTNFGDDRGLDMFLTISQFYPTFTEREARQTFKSCRASGYGFAPFYNICKRYGIYIKDIVFNK